MMMTTATVNWSDHQQATKETNHSQVAGSLRAGEGARTVIDNFRVLTADCRQLVCHVGCAVNLLMELMDVKGKNIDLHLTIISPHLIDHLHPVLRDGLGVAEIPQLPGAVK